MDERGRYVEGEARRPAWLYTESEKRTEIKDGSWCVFVLVRKIDWLSCHFLIERDRLGMKSQILYFCHISL